LARSGNIFANIPEGLTEEEVMVLADRPGAVVERIVSAGQASPAGFWYDQDWTEWVILLEGAAGLLIEGDEAVRILRPGDYLELPAHVRHRVEWTLAGQPTVWLAVHWKGEADGAKSRGPKSRGPSTPLDA
jgi:cupin 2 domain-containing protein